MTQEARIAALERRIETHPTDPAPCRELAEELERAGRLSASARARRLAADRRPDRPIDQFQLARALVLAGGEDLDSEVRLPPAEEASIALRLAVELDPDFGAAYRELARLDLARARELEDEAAVRAAAERAVRRCRQAIELDPGDAEAYRVLGDVHYYVAGAYETARQCYARALELDPAALDARAMLAAALVRTGDPDAARRELHAVLSKKPDHPLAAEALRELD